MTDNNLCYACPRKCGADRAVSTGFCGVGNKFRIARAGLHNWEEPCISFGNGSGTIFFSGCNLKCVFCQNHKISHGLYGKEIDADKLLGEMLELVEKGAVNINLVNPTHYALQLIPVLKSFKEKSEVPIVYNCGGYDSVETIGALEGLVDIYLPDIKYFSDDKAKIYSNCKDYFIVAIQAIKEMHRQVGYVEFDNDCHMIRGVLVRHLVLPTLYNDSISILKELANEFDSSELAISIMSQYFPTYKACEHMEINRKVTTLEYNKVVKAAIELGFVNGFIQQRSSAKEQYVPQFDYGECEDKNEF